jgi:hypothetical protein
MGFPSYFGGRIIFDIFMVTYSYVSLVTYGCYMLHMVATSYICTDLRPILVLFSSKILASAAFRAVFICFQSNISTVLGLPDNSLHHVQNRVHMFIFFRRLIYSGLLGWYLILRCTFDILPFHTSYIWLLLVGVFMVFKQMLVLLSGHLNSNTDVPACFGSDFSQINI